MLFLRGLFRSKASTCTQYLLKPKPTRLPPAVRAVWLSIPIFHRMVQCMPAWSPQRFCIWLSLTTGSSLGKNVTSVISGLHSNLLDVDLASRNMSEVIWTLRSATWLETLVYSTYLSCDWLMEEWEVNLRRAAFKIILSLFLISSPNSLNSVTHFQILKLKCLAFRFSLFKSIQLNLVLWVYPKHTWISWIYGAL